MMLDRALKKLLVSLIRDIITIVLLRLYVRKTNSARNSNYQKYDIYASSTHIQYADTAQNIERMLLKCCNVEVSMFYQCIYIDSYTLINVVATLKY